MNSLENKVPDGSTSIQKNQYNTDKWSLEKTIGDIENKTLNVSCWVNSTVLDTKIGDVEKQISDTNGLVLLLVLIQKLVKLRIKFLMILV